MVPKPEGYINASRYLSNCMQMQHITSGKPQYSVCMYKATARSRSAGGMLLVGNPPGRSNIVTCELRNIVSNKSRHFARTGFYTCVRIYAYYARTSVNLGRQGFCTSRPGSSNKPQARSKEWTGQGQGGAREGLEGARDFAREIGLDWIGNWSDKNNNWPSIDFLVLRILSS